MRTLSTTRLLIIFAIAFSFVSLSGPASSNFHLPTVNLGHANFQACETKTSASICAEFWYPAGAQMDTVLDTIFTDETAEYNAIQSPSSPIDLTDWEMSASLINTFNNQPQFLTTAPTPSVGYYEIQFHLGNVFWGCNFSFGNSHCGVEIRQGIAHMIDKTIFVAKQPNLQGNAAPIDNPVPSTSSGPPGTSGVPSPNPCAYDTPDGFTQTGGNCVVGTGGQSLGGVSYHLASATGANGIPWLQGPGSADLNAAAQHFVNAGLATGFNSATSVLTGISPSASSNIPNFFIRSDNPPRLDLGNSIAEEICYIFTGSYTVPCQFLSVVRGPITAFPGFTTSQTTVDENWWMYTAAFGGPTFFDGSVYFGYNSHFVSGVPSIQPPTPGATCSSAAVPTASAGDYEYVCSPTYDSLSANVENSPCATATGDPVLGATSNNPTGTNGGDCPGVTPLTLSAISAGIKAQEFYGQNVFTLPVFQTINQYGYLNNGWVRVQNNAPLGLANFFTWLNAWNQNPVQAGTIRQGFKETTRSVSPFIASTVWDVYINGLVYDSLYAANPLAPSQTFNWMTTDTAIKAPGTEGYPCFGPGFGGCKAGNVTAPPGTLQSFRFFLRNDMFFQDGTPVTSWDVAFSYLAMVGSGAFGGTGASSMTGITILGPTSFDIGVNSLGSFVLPNLTGIPIFPGRYWTQLGSSSWDSAISTCTSGAGCQISLGTGSQFTLSGPTVNCNPGPTPPAGQPALLSCSTFSAGLMTVPAADLKATFDPIRNHNFVGSGPFQCGTGQLSPSTGSGMCSSSGKQNPPVGGSYTLTRFGAGQAPASSLISIYFRSSGNAALYLWSGANNSAPNAPLSIVNGCDSAPVNLAGTCGHYQQGIGGVNGIGGAAAAVGSKQEAVEGRFYDINWVQPYNWISNRPTGMGAADPLLWEGPNTLTPAPSAASCPGPYYDC